MPRVLAALVRRYGHFDAAEDAVQDALLAASQQWPMSGAPDDPRGWLIRVGSRRLIDTLRADQARRTREDRVVSWVLPSDRVYRESDTDRAAPDDDTLTLLTLCCHPALPQASQVALTLRAVAGLTTTEIARSLVTTADAVTRRISRAKKTIRDTGAPFRMPHLAERQTRLESVMAVIYLTFTEGYAATSGPDLNRPDLVAEAIRLGELLHTLLPDDSEVAGLLALMVLTDARTPARLDEHGDLISMADQRRSLWKHESIRRGVALITEALPRGPVGAYQLQAAIAAVHDEAPTADATDWPQIVALYRLLLVVSPGPIVELNYAVAVAMTDGPTAGLKLLSGLETRLSDNYHLTAARAHMLERAGDTANARQTFLDAAREATNLRHARHLNAHANRLQGRIDHGDAEKCPTKSRPDSL
ncbi:RNA polymerase sigma-70 factor [Rhodococcus sp. AW25M09]|uniref:RNA polymerase sigma factor n=1 Tax=Rhodococcus sp. AW25M09 TaxID=1268303 RepID=UPI0002ABFD88|nr:sigma-70 family RNA polymerase sigma factor [Rhodococcus sp. AW25M09]CCQ18088.1 RNA polymerase sigma-70 factor [Rhodococcus sp. AW25M09]